MTGGAWIFSYGSLVSPESVATTTGRIIEGDSVRKIAELSGYGRRWNYGSLNMRGSWRHDGEQVTDGVVVSLGLVQSDAESCNGVIIRVNADELAALDWRERDYDRVEIDDAIAVEGDRPTDAPIVVYVPRPSSIERYEAARDRGLAAIRASYWALVDEAFAGLGGDHLDRYRATPKPDVPVADITLTVT